MVESRREVNNKEGERKEKAVEVWWDEECRRSKRKVKEELEKWRESGGSGNEYKKSKKEYKKLCDRKKEEEKRKWEKEVEQAKTKGDVWKIVNKGRKERRGVDEKIEIREWKDYFRGVLGGMEWRVGEEVERSKEEDEKKEMEREEFEKVIKKLKKGKAAGSDDIENEIWREGGEEVKEELWEICKRVWKGEGFPEEWREGIVVPVLKKGKGEKVKEYREVTLTQTGYKVYASVLEGKIREEVEEKKIVPQSQAGFRRYMGTMVNSNINQCIVSKENKSQSSFNSLSDHNIPFLMNTITGDED
ncbi:golgin subfamily A member 6-like protein 22 [Cardiocondyla obscurior]|uniref:golgin subfamily A member 6-like protein 22 n=1 Tax=Cardiocondyla obscurior TaxID=286306 RepID=UPI00396577D0